MSQKRRKYKQIEAFFSRVRPAAPDSPLQTAAQPPEPVTPAEDLTGRVEETRTKPSAEDTRPESAVPPAAPLSAGSRQDFINGIDRGRKVGFAYRQGTVTSLEETPLPRSENTFCVPLMVSGKTIGTIRGTGEESSWTAQEIEIVSAVAAQLARHLENLRLLEQDEKRTHE